MFKFIVGSLVGLALCLTVQAQDFRIGAIEGGITANTVCSHLEKGDTVTLASPGGSVREALKISQCVRDKKAIVRVETAFSAATYILLAGEQVCMSRTSVVGFHSPHTYNRKNLRVNFGINQLRDYSRGIGHYLFTWRYTDLEIYAILGITLMTPSNDIAIVPYKDMVTLLGSRFIGACK